MEWPHKQNSKKTPSKQILYYVYYLFCVTILGFVTDNILKLCAFTDPFRSKYISSVLNMFFVQFY